MKRKIKVCLVQPVQSPYWTERLKVLAKEKDLHVTLLLEKSSFSHRPGWRPEPIEGIDVCVLNKGLVFRSIRQKRDIGYEIRGVRSVPLTLPFMLYKLKPDIVVLCNATQIILSLFLKFLTKMRIALIVEDTLYANRDLKKWKFFLKAIAYRQADYWFAFSKDAKTFLSSIGIHKNVIRTCWSLDMKKFLRVKYNNSDKLKVLFSGRLIEGKGIFHLLSAWKKLPLDLRNKAELILAGDGPLREKAQLLVKKNKLDEVKLLGHVNYKKMIEFYKTSDLFILPTLGDLFSLTVLEAMAAGCPVITTPFNGARELVVEGVNGWIVDPTDIDGFRNTIVKALSLGREILNQMGQNARKSVENMDNVIVMRDFAEKLKRIASSKI